MTNDTRTVVRYDYSLYIGSNRLPGNIDKGYFNEKIEIRRAKQEITRLKRKHGVKVCPAHAHISWFWLMYSYEGKVEKRTILKICRRRYVKRNRNGVRTYAIGRFKVNSLRRMKIKLGNNKELYS